MANSISVESGKVVASQVAQSLGQSLEDFLSPLLRQLDEQIDRRLVRTFFVKTSFCSAEMGSFVGKNYETRKLFGQSFLSDRLPGIKKPHFAGWDLNN